MQLQTLAREPRSAGPGTHLARRTVQWREILADIRDAALGTILRKLSHDRNCLSEEAVAVRTERLPYNLLKARKHVDFFGQFTQFRGLSVIDIGCGYGDVAIGLAKAGARRVVGVDLDPLRIDCARRNAEVEGVGHIASFECLDFVTGWRRPETFDCVLSIASFEHILDARQCLGKIYDCLVPGGALLTRFGPLWLSPYGAHMFDFTRVPWVHLLFSEKVVLEVRREVFRPGQAAARYEDIVGHLNRITVSRFRRHATAVGFEPRVFRVNPEKDTKWRGLLRPFNSLLNATPGLRELGAFTLLAVLDKPADSSGIKAPTSRHASARFSQVESGCL